MKIALWSAIPWLVASSRFHEIRTRKIISTQAEIKAQATRKIWQGVSKGAIIVCMGREKWKPTKEELLAAAGKTVPDVIGRGLRLLFVGINPGLYSGAVGHHFARPGNRFWPAVHAGGFTDQLMSPFDERDLLKLGYGVTNIVGRATKAADELSAQELVRGRGRLLAKVRRYRPKFVAVLGIVAYRIAFNSPKTELGRQEEKFGESVLWVLPNPSGLNAHFKPQDLARIFRELREACG